VIVAPIDRLSNRTLLIDVHAMPVLKELVAYLVIERLYKEMALLPDSPVRDGRRTIRSILVIDEAHNYLSQRNYLFAANHSRRALQGRRGVLCQPSPPTITS